jgi:hypothetical protein
MSLGIAYDVFYIDCQTQSSQDQFNLLSTKCKVRKIDFLDTMADTYRYCAQVSTTEWFLLLDGATDYSNFDLNYEVDPWQTQYLHVLGYNTWFGSKHHAARVDQFEKYIEAFPDLHFVDIGLKPICPLLDIVYISNGEPLAEYHYQYLLKNVKTKNKIHRIDRVNGRTEAYKAAATASETPWFFTVFAKLEVNPDFDWAWLPEPKAGPEHYVFLATNPVNNLCYGHMAMIAYNKMLTLSTHSTGLDFTMSKPHSTIPIISGIARYDQDEITAWRTAFREVLKLKEYLKHGQDPDASNKLHTWMTVGIGSYGSWSIRGADDAVEYFDIVGGDSSQIKLSYDWPWLNQYFKMKYSL